MTDTQLNDNQVVPDDTTQSQVPQGEELGESLTAVQGLIERLSGQMDALLKDAKEQQQMLKNVFDNDEELAQAEQQAKEATTTAKDRKTYLNNTQEVRELKTKIADIKEDIKLVKESLNTHLINYFQMTGSTAIDMGNGEEREFKLEAKLKPKKI